MVIQDMSLEDEVAAIALADAKGLFAKQCRVEPVGIKRL